MNPSAKSVEAKPPASGRSALAASLASLILDPVHVERRRARDDHEQPDHPGEDQFPATFPKWL